MTVSTDYYGIQITIMPIERFWRWQVTLPVGATVTSNETYTTPELALAEGKHWVAAETAFYAMNNVLAELCGKGSIHKREYCDLMESVIHLTQRG